jgi:hypothetical protein
MLSIGYIAVQEDGVIGASVTDPRTGEIIKGHVTLRFIKSKTGLFNCNRIIGAI